MTHAQKHEDFFDQDYNYPVLGGVALVQLVRRTFTPGETVTPIVTRVDFSDCQCRA